MQLKFNSQVFLLVVFALLVRTQTNAQTYLPKKGGMCFRFDDYQEPAKLTRVLDIFNKHNVKFTYALNTGIAEAYGDSNFWNLLKIVVRDGHELAEQTPTDVSHFFITKTVQEAQSLAGRPGVDHVTAGSNKVCLKYNLFSAAGGGDESKVDVLGNRIISKAKGEFSWQKLANTRITSHLFLPSRNMLLSMGNIFNANSNDPDTIFVTNFWKETIDLGTASNIDYKKIAIYDLGIEKEGLQTMVEYSQKIFAKYALPLPVTFIHPGGQHPYVSSEALKNALEPLGIKGGASYPFERPGITHNNPKGLKQFLLQGGDITPENNSLTEIYAHLAEFHATNTITVSINHLNAFGAGNSFDQMLGRLEQTIIWCKANNIPIKTYKDWVQVIGDSYFDQTFDIFPPLQNDFNKDKVPDGLKMTNPSLRDTINGTAYSKNVCFSAATTTNVFSINGLYGISRGKNTISLSTRGGASLNDYFNVLIDMPEVNSSRLFQVFTNTPAYTERSFDLEVPAGVSYLNITVSYNTQTNQRAFLSGIKLRTFKKPSFKTARIKRNAQEAFQPINLSNFAACNGYTAAQLQFAVLRAPIHLNASLINLRELRLIPKNNRFWIGIDSLQIRVRAPDNTADTTWFYVQSAPGKLCMGAITPISINTDSLIDQSYAFTAFPADPILNPSNAARVWVKPASNTKYTNTITFKNTTKRTDSISVEVLPSVTVLGATETKHFGAANSLTYTLNYPTHLQVYQYGNPSSAVPNITNQTITIPKPVGFSGVIKTELFVASPTCNASLHTLFSSTYPTSLNEDNLIDQMTVFPNPFSNEINLRNVPNGNWKLQLFSFSGALLFEPKMEIKGGMENKIQLPELESGFYVLKLYSENQVYTRKIIKN